MKSNEWAAVTIIVLIAAIILLVILAGIWLPPAGDFGPDPI